MEIKTLRFAAAVVCAAAFGAFGDVVPTTLRDMYDTNTIYTASQVDQKISEATGGGASTNYVNDATNAVYEAAVKYTDDSISPMSPAFSNAVLSVGLGIDTNTVAAINELVDASHGLPVSGATSVGALLLALAAAIAALKRGKASKADATLTDRGFSEWTFSPATIVDKGVARTLYMGIDSKTGKGFPAVDTAEEGQIRYGVSRDLAGTTEQVWHAGTETPYAGDITAVRTALPGYILGPDDPSNPNRDKPLASEAEAEALRTGKADKSDLDPFLFAKYYPDGSVKSAAEFTQGIKYDDPDTTNRTITVKPFCNTGTAANDNSGLVGRVVIPPFVDAQGNPYISDDGTRFKVVGVSGGGGGFADPNTGLTAIFAPSTVTTIGGDAFFYCSALASVSLPAATSIGDSAFSACTSLTTVSLPAATSIEVAAFNECSALASVSLPAATSIGGYAFAYCPMLATISLPAATTISDSVFYNCSSLTSVDFGDTPRSSVPSLGSGVFNVVPAACKIIVPYTQYDAWKAASGWSSLPQEFVRHAEKADRPSTFTAGNLAKFDANGNPVDSGVKPSDKFASTSAAPAWVSGTSYTVNALVTYNGVIYRCKANTVLPHMAPPDADTTHWVAKPVSDLFLPLAGGTMTGDIGIQASYGIVFSSGDADAVKLEIGYLDGTQVPKLGSRFLAYLDALPYSLVTKTISNNAVTLDDRACNYMDARTLGSSNSLDIDFPALVDGKSRNFVLAVECGANPPAISYAAFVTIMAADASTLTPEQGMNIYAFKEFKPNMFLASRKTVDTVVDNSPESVDQLLLAMQKRGIDTTGITNFGGVATALGLSDTATPQDAIDAIMN